jgi:hypothetical protein
VYAIAPAAIRMTTIAKAHRRSIVPHDFRPTRLGRTGRIIGRPEEPFRVSASEAGSLNAPLVWTFGWPRRDTATETGISKVATVHQ